MRLGGHTRAAQIETLPVHPFNTAAATAAAVHRLPVDLEGIEVAVRLVGPVRAERREASWMLPRLLPTEATQHSFNMMPTG